MIKQRLVNALIIAIQLQVLASFVNPGMAQQETRLYQLLNRDMNLEIPISYITFVNKFELSPQINQRIVELDTTEGAVGFITEAKFHIKFPLVQKRFRGGLDSRDNKIIPFWGYSRIYIDYGVHTRVPRKVRSSPMLPSTNRYGLRYDKVISFKQIHEAEGIKDASINVWSFKKIDTYKLIDNISYKFWTTSFYLHHYSNGQGSGILKPPDSLRNDYKLGDFSTSFVRISLSYHGHIKDKSHFITSLGYQHELGDANTFFAFHDVQLNRYGKQRLIGSVQYIRRIIKKERNFSNIISSIKIRTDLEYIIDYKTLDKYPYEKKHPFGMHVYVDFPIEFLPSVGLMFHGYYGRDFLNIRYDDPIIAFQIGLSLAINRYSLNILEVPPPRQE